MVILKPKLSHPHGRRRLAVWPERGSRSALVSLQRVSGPKGAGAGAGASCGLSRYLRYDSMGKTCWTTWLDSKDFFFLSTSELDMFFFHICFFFWVQLKDMLRLVCVCEYLFFLGRHTFCVCIRSNLFLCPMRVCMCVKPVSLCVEILYGHLWLYLLSNCCFTYSSLWSLFLSFLLPTNRSV